MVKALMYPERVSEITALRAEEAVSSVPKEPLVGLATVQSVVSFGHRASLDQWVEKSGHGHWHSLALQAHKCAG